MCVCVCVCVCVYVYVWNKSMYSVHASSSYDSELGLDDWTPVYKGSG